MTTHTSHRHCKSIYIFIISYFSFLIQRLINCGFGRCTKITHKITHFHRTTEHASCTFTAMLVHSTQNCTVSTILIWSVHNVRNHASPSASRTHAYDITESPYHRFTGSDQQMATSDRNGLGVRR